MVLPASVLEAPAAGATAVFATWAAVGAALFFGSIYAARRHADTVGFILAPALMLAVPW
jgi:hypothetical protein